MLDYPSILASLCLSGNISKDCWLSAVYGYMEEGGKGMHGPSIEDTKASWIQLFDQTIGFLFFRFLGVGLLGGEGGCGG